MTEVLGDPERHFWITRSVARTMGLSLSEEMARGRLSDRDYAQMVTRCRGCARTQDCEEWLASCQTQARSAPPGCINAEALNALRRMH